MSKENQLIVFGKPDRLFTSSPTKPLLILNQMRKSGKFEKASILPILDRIGGTCIVWKPDKGCLFHHNEKQDDIYTDIVSQIQAAPLLSLHSTRQH